jgi:tRNA pseudouridine55 synthase
VRDLGRQLGCGAHLAALHRSAIGPWNDPGPDNVAEIRGRDLLPWLASRELTDQEVGELRAGRTIAAGEMAPPTWPLPQDFPPPAPRVRGIHLEKLAFILEPEQDRLRSMAALHGGV